MSDRTALDSLLSGSSSSAITVLLYQPLELIKTRIQLQADHEAKGYVGRAFRISSNLVRANGIRYLWTGLSPSILRSVPGTGLYYATLNILHTALNEPGGQPKDAFQAFCLGLASRSIVSFALLPVSVVKVRYESGKYSYPSVIKATKDAYKIRGGGWSGIAPTIFRDSLFSGVYYMCYTEMNKLASARSASTHGIDVKTKFLSGICSGFLASVITNPLDVIKTQIQVSATKKTVRQVSKELVSGNNGYMHFFDGLLPRSVRRTLVAATTWTFYEILMDSMR